MNQANNFLPYVYSMQLFGSYAYKHNHLQKTQLKERWNKRKFWVPQITFEKDTTHSRGVPNYDSSFVSSPVISLAHSLHSMSIIYHPNSFIILLSWHFHVLHFWSRLHVYVFSFLCKKKKSIFFTYQFQHPVLSLKIVSYTDFSSLLKRVLLKFTLQRW